MSFAFNYIFTEGILSEKLYPYKPGKDKCDRNQTDNKNSIFIDFTMVVVDESHMKDIVGE